MLAHRLFYSWSYFGGLVENYTVFATSFGKFRLQVEIWLVCEPPVVGLTVCACIVFVPPLQCLVLGAGPCGLRTAIELSLLGAEVVVLEKRETFSRNNVLHLWPFTIYDLRSLGAKKFYGKFCTGSLDHISEWLLTCDSRVHRWYL